MQYSTYFKNIVVVLPGPAYFNATGKNLPSTKTTVKLQQDFCLNSIKHFELQETTQPNLKVVLRSHLRLKFSTTGKFFIIVTALKKTQTGLYQ